jgi:hypothetical protein
VNECREDAEGFSFRERLVVRHSNCDPVTLIELPEVGPIPDPLHVCPLYGRVRIGAGGVIVSRLQRLAVTPDARGVVIEITNDHSVFRTLSPDPPDEGIFYLRTDGRSLPDGTKMRKIGTPSAVPIVDATFTQVGFNFIVSADNRTIVFEDRGPDADGHDAQQVFVIDLTNDEGKKQITHVPAGPPGVRGTGNAFFVDDHTIGFWNAAESRRFTVRTDGTGLRPVPNPAAVPGAEVVPVFGIVRNGAAITTLHFPGRTPVDDYSSDRIVRELLVLDGTGALQLTDYGYSDTGVYSTIGKDRIFFAASADPLGQNPQGICQMFSISPLGRHLRQLTRFTDVGRRKNGCWPVPEESACKVTGIVADPVTKAVGFVSSCDPLGRARNGEQFFAMRPDGTRLRQTTAFRGVEPLPGGGVQAEMAGSGLLVRDPMTAPGMQVRPRTVTVELPGPTACPGRTF